MGKKGFGAKGIFGTNGFQDNKILGNRISGKWDFGKKGFGEKRDLGKQNLGKQDFRKPRFWIKRDFGRIKFGKEISRNHNFGKMILVKGFWENRNLGNGNLGKSY